MTAVAADGYPIAPLVLPNGCVDVNVGQRCVVCWGSADAQSHLLLLGASLVLEF